MTKNGFAGQSLGDQPALLLLRGKSGRSESPPADVAEAVNALMQAVHFPAAASITSQVGSLSYGIAAACGAVFCLCAVSHEHSNLVFIVSLTLKSNQCCFHWLKDTMYRQIEA